MIYTKTVRCTRAYIYLYLTSQHTELIHNHMYAHTRMHDKAVPTADSPLADAAQGHCPPNCALQIHSDQKGPLVCMCVNEHVHLPVS